MTKRRHGFTLVEMVVVLGILAVYIAPKYVDFGGNAHKSAVQAMYGTVRAAAEMVHSTATFSRSTGCVTMADGTVVNIGSSSCPVASSGGISAAVFDTNDFTYSYNSSTSTATFTRPDAPNSADCWVAYTYNGVGVPVTTFNSTGCS